MKIKVAVACRNTSGKPDIVPYLIDCTEAQYIAGAHYRMATQRAKDEQYDEPYFAFDERDPAWTNTCWYGAGDADMMGNSSFEVDGVGTAEEMTQYQRVLVNAMERLNQCTTTQDVFRCLNDTPLLSSSLPIDKLATEKFQTFVEGKSRSLLFQELANVQFRVAEGNIGKAVQAVNQLSRSLLSLRSYAPQASHDADMERTLVEEAIKSLRQQRRNYFSLAAGADGAKADVSVSSVGNNEASSHLAGNGIVDVVVHQQNLIAQTRERLHLCATTQELLKCVNDLPLLPNCADKTYEERLLKQVEEKALSLLSGEFEYLRQQISTGVVGKADEADRLLKQSLDSLKRFAPKAVTVVLLEYTQVMDAIASLDLSQPRPRG